ncbi:MAG: hypothetical protein JW884_02210, partial [Deltaproteobacteria bacterium]|nr:hypothetical protein [Deltaproteobacteria bacterium]
STLPQALSAEAEMTARYKPGGIDGVSSCLQRVHVTSGATGILVEHLRRHRPFTPSFIDRAEDQAYLLSAMTQPEPRLAYVHEPGLIMRHDIDLFADKKSETSRIDKLVSDYIRTLHFSAYAEALAGGDISAVKSFLNPYTGAYISPIPVTLTYLRFAMKAASFYAEGKDNQGFEFIRQGASRIAAALKLTSGKNAALKDILSKERQGWDLYYDTLDAIEKALAAQESIALDLREKARTIIKDCLITEYK